MEIKHKNKSKAVRTSFGVRENKRRRNMVKRMLSLMLAYLLLSSVCAVSGAGRVQAGKEAVEVKAKVAKLGTGPNARVEVKFKDGARLKGYVSQREDDYFVVTDPNTGTTTKVPYADVKQVKGSNHSSGAKILIGGLALLAGVIALIVIAGRSE
jgi:cell division protein FtsB